MDWVTTASQFVSSALSYLVNLWTKTHKQLDDSDKAIWDFIWSGQDSGKLPRVDWETMKRDKGDSGIGVISMKEQTVALFAKAMLEILGDGDHMVQHILWKKIGALVEAKWGRDDFSWLVDLGRKKPEEESILWSAFCDAWIYLSKFILPSCPSSWEKKKAIPLWVPHRIHKVRAKSIVKWWASLQFKRSAWKH